MLRQLLPHAHIYLDLHLVQTKLETVVKRIFLQHKVARGAELSWVRCLSLLFAGTDAWANARMSDCLSRCLTCLTDLCAWPIHLHTQTHTLGNSVNKLAHTHTHTHSYLSHLGRWLSARRVSQLSELISSLCNRARWERKRKGKWVKTSRWQFNLTFRQVSSHPALTECRALTRFVKVYISIYWIYIFVRLYIELSCLLTI